MLLDFGQCCPMFDNVTRFWTLLSKFWTLISSFGQYFLTLDGIIQFWKLLFRFVRFNAVLEREKLIFFFSRCYLFIRSQKLDMLTDKEKYVILFDGFSCLNIKTLMNYMGPLTNSLL